MTTAENDLRRRLHQIAADRARGCICDQLPADIGALAADREAHARECPLYVTPPGTGRSQ